MTETEIKETIGERLHKARLKKKVTIDEAYRDTKIHPKILNALEADKYDDFLSPTYIKAFLKSYCRYLEVDANRILADYDSLRKEPVRATLAVKDETKQAFFPDINWQRYTALGKKWLLPVGGIILGIILSVSLIILASKTIARIKNIKILEAKINKSEPAPAPAIKKPLSIPKDQPLALIVKTKGDVWLEVKSDGKTLFKSVLKKGSVEAYKADERLQLWTGKGEFLDLVLNGNPLGSPGNGVIKNIILTREGLKIEKK